MVRESRRQRARRLGRISFDVLREDRRLLVFPAMSVVVSLLLGGIAFALAVDWIGGHSRLVIFVAATVASYPVTFVMLFAGVALAAMLAAKLNGQPISAAEGWRVARQRAGAIARWTLLDCTVGAVLRALEQCVPFSGKIVTWLADLSWSLATLFAVPVLAYENLGPRATLRRSSELFRQRWAEQTGGLIAIGFATGLASLPFVCLVVVGFTVGSSGGMIMVACGGAGLLALTTFDAALNEVYRIFLYRTTVTPDGGTLNPFPPEDLENPWRRRPALPALSDAEIGRML